MVLFQNNRVPSHYVITLCIPTPEPQGPVVLTNHVGNLSPLSQWELWTESDTVRPPFELRFLMNFYGENFYGKNSMIKFISS